MTQKEKDSLSVQGRLIKTASHLYTRSLEMWFIPLLSSQIATKMDGGFKELLSTSNVKAESPLAIQSIAWNSLTLGGNSQDL